MSDQVPPSATAGQAKSDGSSGRSGGPPSSISDAVTTLERKIAFSSYIRMLVEQVGPEIFAEPDRFRAFLMDQFPRDRREIGALHNAAKGNVAEALLRASKNDTDIEPKRQFCRLEEQFGLSSALAAWTINVLTLALGNSSEISHTETDSSANSATGSVAVGEQQAAEHAAPEVTTAENKSPDSGNVPFPALARLFQPVLAGATRRHFLLGAAAILTAVVTTWVVSASRMGPTTTLLTVPDGTYTGAHRGWTTNAPGVTDATCKSSYPEFPVSVMNGTIRFSSDGSVWIGSIDQRTGFVNIRPSPENSQNNLQISGHYTNATMTGQRNCLSGYFRFDVNH